MNHKPSMLPPALIAGGAFGVASAVPVLGLLNCACCLLVVCGGALSVYLYQQKWDSPVQYGDGALLGLLAGLFATVADTLVSLPLKFLGFDMATEWMETVAENVDDPEVQESIRQALEMMGEGGATALAVISEFFFSLVIFAIFSTLGGIIGVALFQKKNPTPGPMPPTSAPPVPPSVG